MKTGDLQIFYLCSSTEDVLVSENMCTYKQWPETPKIWGINIQSTLAKIEPKRKSRYSNVQILHLTALISHEMIESWLK